MQFSNANFETHLVGLAFVRFFLTDSKRTASYADIIKSAENIYFAMLSDPPTFLKVAFLGSKYKKSQETRYRAAYGERKDIYYRLFENCKTFRLDPAEDLFRQTVNGPGLDLHETILWNVFSSSSGLHRPSHKELIKISYDTFRAVLFAYDFLNRNWEELVMDR